MATPTSTHCSAEGLPHWAFGFLRVGFSLPPPPSWPDFVSWPNLTRPHSSHSACLFSVAFFSFIPPSCEMLSSFRLPGKCLVQLQRHFNDSLPPLGARGTEPVGTQSHQTLRCHYSCVCDLCQGRVRNTKNNSSACGVNCKVGHTAHVC